METGNMPEKWEGDFRMVLLDDNGNIVDQYQPCAIVAENGAMMKGTGDAAMLPLLPELMN